MEPSSPYAPAYVPPATVVHRCHGIFFVFLQFIYKLPRKRSYWSGAIHSYAHNQRSEKGVRSPYYYSMGR